jgi:hypothetical protein
MITHTSPIRPRGDYGSSKAWGEAAARQNVYGIWPWLAEESLAEMAPPDWNWADFCGMRLALVLYIAHPMPCRCNHL